MISCPLDREDNFYIVIEGGIYFYCTLKMKTESNLCKLYTGISFLKVNSIKPVISF